MPHLPLKPKFGDACNGCGKCCAEEICPVGIMAYPGAQAPCPALKITPEGDRTYCQFIAVEIAEKLPPMLQLMLGIGKGCSMPDNESQFPDDLFDPADFEDFVEMLKKTNVGKGQAE